MLYTSGSHLGCRVNLLGVLPDFTFNATIFRGAAKYWNNQVRVPQGKKGWKTLLYTQLLLSTPCAKKIECKSEKLLAKILVNLTPSLVWRMAKVVRICKKALSATTWLRRPQTTKRRNMSPYKFLMIFKCSWIFCESAMVRFEKSNALTSTWTLNSIVSEIR